MTVREAIQVLLTISPNAKLVYLDRDEDFVEILEIKVQVQKYLDAELDPKVGEVVTFL